MSKLRQLAQGLRPASITGGAPFYPLFVLFGLNAVDELDRTAFSVLVPEIKDHFDLDLQGVLTLLSLVGVAVVLIQVPVAFLADRTRRTRIATIGATVWMGFSVLTGLAPFIWVLAIARAGSGVGRAVNDPTHNSLLADYYDIDVRPKVYGFHRAANSIGQFLGPVAGGFLAYFYGWRAPFLLFAIPTLVFVVLSRRLPEPTRGAKERAFMGASAEVVATEETPPSFAESWRILWQIGSLRRMWFAMPFLASAFFGFASLLSIYYEELFGLDERARGVVFGVAEPAQLIGLAVGIPIAYRLMQRDPGLSLKLVGIVLALTGGLWFILVFSRSLALSMTAHVVITGFFAIIAPTILAVFSLAIPPRVRSMGFTVGSLWYLPGVLLLIIIGGVADEYGVRIGLALMVPILLTGAIVITSGARYVAADINKVRTSAVALSDVMAGRDRGEVKLLLVRSLDVSYESVQVLFGVDFEVDEGEIIALLGTNGAGKSTLLKAISGLVEAQAGAIVFDGRDMTYAPPHEIAARGVLQVPGGRGVFPSLTVSENIGVAGWLCRRDPARLRQATDRVLEFFPILRERWNTPAGNMSGGEQQMLTLAQAFIIKPRLLMIDELSLGLAPAIVEQLLGIVRAMAADGTTIIVVEQSVNVALTIADTAYFMEKGEVRYRGSTADLLDRPDILRSVFLQGAASLDVPEGEHTATTPIRTVGRTRVEPGVAEGQPVLQVRDVRKRFGGVSAVSDVSFELRSEEILGIIGPNGAGKTTLFDLLSGFVRPDAGTIVFDGIDITSMAPDVRSRIGLGRSFQDARLFPALPVSATIALALDRNVDVRDPLAAALHLPAVAVSEAAVAKRVEELIKLMGLEAFRDKFVRELSTGSRRMVDLACVLAHEPKVLLFDEPSSGIAQRETEALGPLLNRIRDATGASLLVIEHDMPLITDVATRMMALDLGQIVTVGAPDDVVNHPQVVASYLGSTREVIHRSGAVPPPRATVRTPSRRRERPLVGRK